MLKEWRIDTKVSKEATVRWYSYQDDFCMTIDRGTIKDLNLVQEKFWDWLTEMGLTVNKLKSTRAAKESIFLGKVIHPDYIMQSKQRIQDIENLYARFRVN